MAKDNTDSRVMISDATATGAGGSIANVSGTKTYQATGLTSASTGAAVIAVQGSNDGSTWDATAIGTITLTLGTTATSDGFTSADCYRYVRGNVTSISGTGAVVDLAMAF